MKLLRTALVVVAGFPAAGLHAAEINRLQAMAESPAVAEAQFTGAKPGQSPALAVAASGQGSGVLAPSLAMRAPIGRAVPAINRPPRHIGPGVRGPRLNHGGGRIRGIVVSAILLGAVVSLVTGILGVSAPLGPAMLVGAAVGAILGASL